MLFMIVGFLKPDAEKRLIDFSDEFNEHVAHPALAVAGALRDSDGRRKGYMAFIDAEEIGEAERYLHGSPFYQAGLYERCEVLRYAIEVGNIESNAPQLAAGEPSGQ